MTKTVSLSTNDHEDYIKYLPYVQKAWNALGWDTITFYLGGSNLESTDQNKIVKIESIGGIRDATVVQVSRLFAHKHADGLIMTSDVDMMPLSNYWKPDLDKFTCYGKDLTHGRHYPICYISAPKFLWEQAIQETSIKELLLKYDQCKSNVFESWWFTDQDIITERLKNFKTKEIPRGFEGRFAYGRIDRDDWAYTKNISQSKKIDAHMPRPFSQYEAENLVNKIGKLL